MENQEIAISHYLLPARIKALTSDSLPSFCTFKLPHSVSELITADGGQILVQTLSHYIANVQVAEYRMNQDVSIDLCVKQSAILMFILLNGRSILYDKKNRVVSETLGNCFTLIHMTPGNYRRTLSKGNHKIVVLTFRTDWFLQKVHGMQELAPLIENHLTETLDFCALPHCSISNSILGLLEKLKSDKVIDPAGNDIKIYSFINDCIARYHRKLVDAHYDTNTINKNRANEIVNYIKANFNSKSVEDVPQLAKSFGLSEKNLLRLVKTGFGKPLHDRVTYLRMHYALKMLLTSCRPINDVAITMGYNDPLYFSKVFKKYHKVSPSDVHRLCM